MSTKGSPGDQERTSPQVGCFGLSILLRVGVSGHSTFGLPVTLTMRAHCDIIPSQ